MSNYLQRLLDRSAPPTPARQPVNVGVQPAGPSHSPISLSDQRLNDPDFAERYALPTEGLERFNNTDSERPSRHVLPRTNSENRPFESIPAQPQLGPASPTLDSAPPSLNSAPQQANEMGPKELATESNKPADPLLFRPVGFVDSTDLVLPEPESASNNDVVPSPPRPQEPALKQGPNDPTERQIASPQKISTPKRAPMSLNETKESPLHPAVKPVPVTPELKVQGAEKSSSVTMASELRPVVEALPPLVEVPVVPDPPIPAPRQPDPAPKPPPAVQTAQKPPTQSESTKTNRTHPMTAAEASIIGPFSPRRRALTIFGLRRR